MNKLESLTQWLTEQIDACARQQQALTADQRTDEATFQKIAGNVYGIFRTVLSAARKACKSDAEAQQFFLNKLAQIPTSWERSHQLAQLHEDGEKEHIEAVKLDAVQNIQAAVRELWED